MNDLITEIAALEWEDFQKVNSSGGRAACQDDKHTFEINRKSQFMTWNEPTLRSYLADLKTARAEGRNLLMEKYARMMAWTHPGEYKELEPHLPPVSPEAWSLVESIAYAQAGWQREFAAAYPRLASRGRPVRSGNGVPDWLTSFETYLRGELLTYSLETLGLYSANIAMLKQRGMNMSMVCMEYMVKLSGFDSLDQAEAAS